MPRPERSVALPSRRADGTWKYPLQIQVSEHGKYKTGYATFELVGYACDLEHRQKLQECLR